MISPKDWKIIKIIVVLFVTLPVFIAVFFYSCVQCIIANDKGELAVEINNMETKKIDIYNPDGTYKTSIPIKSYNFDIYLKNNHIFAYISHLGKIQEYDFDGNLLSEKDGHDLWVETRIRKVKAGDIVYKHELIFGVDSVYRIDENGNSKNILLKRADIFIEKIRFWVLLYICEMFSLLVVNDKFKDGKMSMGIK